MSSAAYEMFETQPEEGGWPKWRLGRDGRRTTRETHLFLLDRDFCPGDNVGVPIAAVPACAFTPHQRVRITYGSGLSRPEEADVCTHCLSVYANWLHWRRRPQ